MNSSAELEARLRGRRFGIIGVGNVLKGDDGAGPALIARLAATGAPFPIVDAAEVPENYGGWVEKQALEAVVFADAVIMDARPGEWRVVPVEDLMRSASNTHRLSLHFTIQYLREVWGGEAILIGIQPKSMRLGDPLSPEVEETVRGIADVLYSISPPRTGS